MMFEFDRISEYQLEITTYCNAACPQCPRNHNGQGINRRMPLCHLDRAVIDEAFSADLCSRLRQVFFCGSYGDPIMHPDFLDILEDFRCKDKDLWLYVHTNGGVHDADWWRHLAQIMRGHGQIDFGIDGLEDTLALYRRNVSYHKVMTNARAFIQAGGRAQWNFIVFRHNQHQVDQARELAGAMGFHHFLARKTGRFFNHRTIEEMPAWPVADEYQIHPPDLPEYRNQTMLWLPDIRREYANMRDYFNSTRIQCDALIGPKLAINAEGLVLPCNFFNHNLYDRRFYEADVLPEAHELSMRNGRNQVRVFLEDYGLSNLNIHHYSLEEILSNPMWQDLVQSWSRTLDQGRLFECAMTCGQRLTKVWDQGGSTR